MGQISFVRCRPAELILPGKSAKPQAKLPPFLEGAFSVLTVLLLIGSNAFMTMAWYGHLKFKATPMVAAIFISWLIALPEYLLQVPANRLGHVDDQEQTAADLPSNTRAHGWWRAQLSTPQLKILQEVITISVFVVFNFLYLHEKIRATDWAGFGLIVLAIVVMMYPRIADSHTAQQKVSNPSSIVPEIVAIEPVDGHETS
jgi:hypothetical protein